MSFYFNNRFIINTILLIFLFSLAISLILEENRFFLSGEYAFSFDYLGHINNIIQDFKTDPRELLRSTECIDCINFYHYSRWYSLIMLSILQIGVFLGLHPFMSYIFMSVSMQMIALYIAFRIFFREVNKIAYIASSVFLIIYPYKFSLIGSGSLYSLHYAFLITYHSLLIYLLSNLKSLKTSKITKYSLLIGAASSFFLNISIGYFPIVFYSTIAIILFFYKHVFSNIKKFVVMFGIIAATAAIVNIPIIYSIIQSGKSHIYANFSSYSITNALTAGLFYYSKLKIEGIFLIGIILYLAIISRLSLRSKIIFASIYLITGIILIGNNISPSLYDFVFNNFPLMNSIRSTHRFIFFELFIIVIFIYSGLSYMLTDKKIFLKMSGVFLSAILIFLPGYNIFLNKNYIQTSFLPNEYLAVDTYLQNNETKIIYFPSYMPVFHDMNGNYNWLPVKEVPLGLIYANPFTSLLSIKNLVHVETFMTSPKSQELRALTHHTNPPNEVIKALGYAGIERLIIDKNFMWDKVFPEFDLNELEKGLKLRKRFGNIYIYDVPAIRDDCLKFYGNFKLGYCIDHKNPKVFIEKTKKDFILDQISQSEYSSTISFNRSKKVIHLIIADPSLTEYVIANKIFITTSHIHVDEPINDIYTTKVTGNKYLLSIPVLKVKQKSRFFGNMYMEITVNGVVKKRISPYSEVENYAWEQIVLDLKKDEEHIINIQTKEDGAMVFGSPMLLELFEYKKFDNDIQISIK
jgi:hypothetical protein